MSNGPPFYCPHCGAGPFSTRDEMRKHIYDAHLKEGQRLLLAEASMFHICWKGGER